MNLQRKEMFEQASFLRDELERLSNNYYYDSINSESLKNTDVIGVVSNKEVLEISSCFSGADILLIKRYLQQSNFMIMNMRPTRS